MFGRKSIAQQKPAEVLSVPSKRALPIPDGLAAHEKLFDLYDRMIGDVDLTAVLRDIAGVVCKDLNAERATVYLVNRETEELESLAVVGNVGRVIRVPIRNDSLAGFCAMTGRSFVAPDVYGDLHSLAPDVRFDARWDKLTGFHTRDVMCAPARFKGQVVGVIQVMNHKGSPFSADDLLPLGSIARLIGYSLYHARLYDDLATMKRLDQEKAKFMRVLVHELKSPAAAVKMMTDLLGNFPAEHPKVRSLHERIAGRTDEMIDLIRDILVLAKLKSGEAMGEIAVLNLLAEAERCSRRYRESAEQKGLSMELSLPGEPLSVRMDDQGCRLILSNLVSNAVKYTAQGSVKIALWRDGRRAVLEVRDTGIGIPEADLPKVFREFFRASNAKSGAIPGSGVGLSGVKHLVERFGGTLALKSVENEGSIVTVRLPLFREE